MYRSGTVSSFCVQKAHPCYRKQLNPRWNLPSSLASQWVEGWVHSEDPNRANLSMSYHGHRLVRFLQISLLFVCQFDGHGSYIKQQGNQGSDEWEPLAVSRRTNQFFQFLERCSPNDGSGDVLLKRSELDTSDRQSYGTNNVPSFCIIQAHAICAILTFLLFASSSTLLMISLLPSVCS